MKLLSVLLIAAFPTSLFAQNFDQIEIRTIQVRGSIYMLQGSGGNIGVSVGSDGTFIIDDQYAPLTDKINAAIAELSDMPVQFVINTHWHYDHTDGNENFGGAGAIIVAHENSRKRMEENQVVVLGNRPQPAYAEVGLPKITFAESIRFHYNGEPIDVFHTAPGHTDGDAIVFFLRSNVVHTGDVFVRYGFPFIDQPNGGSVEGIIEAVAALAAMIDEDTVIIPGHGQLSSRTDLLEYGAMLQTIRDRVQRQIDEGRSFEEVVESNPTEGFPAAGMETVFFIRTVYDGLRERR